VLFLLCFKNQPAAARNGYSNGYNGTAYNNDSGSKQVNKFPGKTSHLHGSSMSRFHQVTNGNAVPAVVLSSTDDLVNLDDLRVAIQKNSVSTVERILSFG
jgi:hypothetical protein